MVVCRVSTKTQGPVAQPDVSVGEVFHGQPAVDDVHVHPSLHLEHLAAHVLASLVSPGQADVLLHHGVAVFLEHQGTLTARPFPLLFTQELLLAGRVDLAKLLKHQFCLLDTSEDQF